MRADEYDRREEDDDDDDHDQDDLGQFDDDDDDADDDDDDDFQDFQDFAWDDASPEPEVRVRNTTKSTIARRTALPAAKNERKKVLLRNTRAAPPRKPRILLPLCGVSFSHCYAFL